MQLIRDHPVDTKPIVFVVRLNPEGFKNLDGGKLLRAENEKETGGDTASQSSSPAETNLPAVSGGRPKTKEEIYTGKPVTIKLLTTPYGFTITGPAPSTKWFDRKGVFIAKVKPGKAAEQAGALVGMQILKVNGKDTKKSSKAECTQSIKDAMEMPGKVMTMVVLFNPAGYAQFDGGALVDEYADVAPSGSSENGGEADDGSSSSSDEDAPPEVPARSKKSPTAAAGASGGLRARSAAAAVQLNNLGSSRLFEGLLGESSSEDAGSAAAGINLQAQLGISCAEKRWTTVQMFGLPSVDGYYQVVRDSYLGEPVYVRTDTRLPQRKIWYSQQGRNWVVSPDVGAGPAFARSPSGFARPQLVTTPWAVAEVDHTYEFGCCPMCELASTSIRHGFRAIVSSSPEITLENRTLSSLEIADLCAEIQDPASRLEQLKMYHISLPAEALHAICEALGQNVVLKQLQIRECSLKDPGAFEIANVLRRNTTLEMLSLRANAISTHGVKAISDALVGNKDSGLHMLSLGDNRLDQDGMYFLIAAARLNRSLHGIAVYGHGMEPKTAKKMWKKAKKSTKCVFDAEIPVA